MSRNPQREGKFQGLSDDLLEGVQSSAEEGSSSISRLSDSLREGLEGSEEEDSTGESSEEEEEGPNMAEVTYRVPIRFGDITGTEVDLDSQYIICINCWDQDFYLHRGRFRRTTDGDKPTLTELTDTTDFSIELREVFLIARGLPKI